MLMKTLKDVDVAGKRVLVRVDFNVPLQDGVILDDTRITAALPTITYLIERKAQVILVTHLGRPKGKVVPAMSVRPLVKHISNVLGRRIKFASDCGGLDSQRVVSEMSDGEVVLLENVRFDPGEETNDEELGNALAKLAEIYVDDAFGDAHRAHASTVVVTEYLPAVAGFLMEKEVNSLSAAIENPERPFAMILGGAKVEDKIPVVENLLGKIDFLLIGGVMGNTFLKAQGYDLGSTRVDEEGLAVARDIIKKAAAKGVELVLPLDLVVADKFDPEAGSQVVDIDKTPAGWMALDIGPATIQAFTERLQKAKTIVWNGPLGVYEFDKFAVGTIEIAKAMAKTKAKTIVGGGDVVAAIEKAGVAEQIFHISTGGGASLEFLAGQSLPGVAALLKK